MNEFSYKNYKKQGQNNRSDLQNQLRDNQNPANRSRAGSSDDEPFIPLHKLKAKQKSTDDPITYKTLRAINRRRNVIIVGVLVILVGFFAYKYFTANNELKKASDFTNNSEELAQAIQDEVSKYISDLPKEVPKLDTINDPSAAEGSTLFKDAQKGDKVLFYESAGKVLIYRPSTKQIVIYTYVSSGQPSNEQDQNTEALPDSSSSGDTNNESTTVPGTVVPTQGTGN